MDTDRPRPVFGKLPLTVLASAAISAGAKVLFAAIKHFARQDPGCFPSQDTLAAAIGRSQRTVRRRLQELVDAGLIESRRLGLGRTNYYEVRDAAAGPAVSAPERSILSGPERTTLSAPERSILSGPERTTVSAPERTRLSCPIRGQEADGLEAAAAEAPTSAAAVFLRGEKEIHPAAAALQALGLPAPLAGQLAAGDQDLALAVAGYCRERFADASLRPVLNKTGFVIRLLRDPEGTGFTRGSSGWRRPPAAGKSAEAADRARRAAEAAGKAEEGRRREEEARKRGEEQYRANRRRWESLTADQQAAVRVEARARFAWLRNRADEHWQTIDACFVVMEAWQRDGKLPPSPEGEALSPGQRPGCRGSGAGERSCE